MVVLSHGPQQHAGKNILGYDLHYGFVFIKCGKRNVGDAVLRDIHKHKSCWRTHVLVLNEG